MNKRGAEESLSFLTGIVIAIIIAIPMFMLIWNFVESTQVKEKQFNDLVDVIASMEVGDEREFGFFIKDKSIVSFSKEQAEKYNLECVDEYCLCLCDVDRGLFHLDFEDSCKEGICEGFNDIKLVGKKVDDQIIIIEKELNEISVQIKKKEIDGEEIISMCIMDKFCV